MSIQIELLEQTFNYIKPYRNQFISSFYETLCQTSPRIKSLFADLEPETAKNQLWDSLVIVMENLDQPETLNNFLQGLGARLSTYGVFPKDYPRVRDAFFATCKQFLGSEWTTEVKQAWLDAYATFSGMMLDGANQAQKQMAKQTHPTTATAIIKSYKELLVGGGIIGAIAIILLLILL